MSTFFDIDCGGETVTIEKTDDGDFIFHGWDEEAELAAIELGFEPSTCWSVWEAINNDTLDTELIYHADQANALLVKTLLFAGASVDAKDDTDWTPLHEAARWGCSDVVRILLKAGASVDAKDWNGRTLLHMAAWYGHADITKILLEAGAKADVRDGVHETPLDHARMRKHDNVIAILKDWIAEHGA